MNRDITGFLIGLCAGAGIAVMFAPRAGEKTRALLRKKANEGAASLLKRGTGIRDAATETIREGARKVTGQTEAVKAAVDAGKHAYSKAIHS